MIDDAVICQAKPTVGPAAKGLVHAFVYDFILRAEQTLAENVQKRAKEQTAARRAAAAKPVAAIRKPVVAVASRRGKTHTGQIPPWRRASANDGIVGMTQEDQTEDKAKRQERWEKYAQWL